MTLLIGTTVLLRMNKGKYAWMTGVPGLLMTVITIWAGIWLVVNQYLPNGQHLLATLSCVVMLLDGPHQYEDPYARSVRR